MPAPWGILESLWKHPSLIYTMARRDVAGRYRGSALGLLWSLANPLFMLTVYTVVFRNAFGATWGVAGGATAATATAGATTATTAASTTATATAAGHTTPQFALIVFSGMVVFLFFSECVTRAPSLILQHANYVKRVVFPLEILPWVALFSALFHMGVNLLVLLAASLAIRHSVPWTCVFLPLPLICVSLLAMGLMWFLASLGVFLRDMIPTVALVTNMVMFVSPVFYDAETMRSMRIFYALLRLNPLTFIIEQTRDIVLWGNVPNVPGLILYALGAALFAWLGLAWFQKTRKGFADVI